MYPDKQKDIEVIKALKEKKFIDAKMAGYITDKIVELMPNLKWALDKYDISPKDMIRLGRYRKLMQFVLNSLEGNLP